MVVFFRRDFCVWEDWLLDMLFFCYKKKNIEEDKFIVRLYWESMEIVLEIYYKDFIFN